jgi:hypothetical protein
MNREKLLEIVNEVINERLEQLIEEMSTNEFVEMITDKYVEKTGDDLEKNNFEYEDEIQEVIGERVVPLLTKITEYVIGVDLPKN